MQNDLVLKAEHISKSFGGNKVLDDVQLEVYGGTVHALCGENGAGKSTILKIITGLYTKDSGEIYLNGARVDITNVETARSRGIHVVPQEMQILPELSVAENIFQVNAPRTKLGLIDWKKLYAMADDLKKLLGRHGDKINVRAKAGQYGMGIWQLIEIMRAFTMDNLRVIAFDEPTASLSDSEVETLFSMIRDLKDRGIAIVYVSHRLKEIFELCDAVSVFRDGRYIGTRKVSETTNDELIAMMIGRDVNLFGDRTSHVREGEVTLRVKNFSHGKYYRDISLMLRKGEILGLYGLVGAGRTEFVRGLFGVDPRDSGEIEINGSPVAIKTPRDAIRHGMGLVTEARREEGLITTASIKLNLSMTNLDAVVNRFGNISTAKEEEYAREGLRIFRTKAAGIEMPAGGLSGGNQQKIVLAKWVRANCDILIVDEPTRGIDVGAKAEVYSALHQLAKEGKSILMVSSELPEILGVSDRIIVMCEGRMTAELINDGLREEDVIKYAFEE